VSQGCKHGMPAFDAQHHAVAPPAAAQLSADCVKAASPPMLGQTDG